MKRVDPAVLHLMRGRAVERIDASRANILEICFTDGSMLEFETVALGHGLYGNELSQYKVGDQAGIEPAKDPLDFDALRSANVVRCEAEDGYKHHIPDWNVLEWAGATAGEAGEAANAAKKLRRGDYGSPGTAKYDEGRAKLARELADTVLYADLTAAREGIDLGDAIKETFNAKSVEIGSKYRL